MMPMQVTCGACGQRFNGPDRAPGRQTRCPSCQSPLSVPDAARDAEAAGQAARKTNAFGVASLVLGAIALLISWVPVLGMGAWPLGGLGVVLGVVGIVIAARTRRVGYPSAVVGTTLGGVAIVLATVVTSLFGRALDEARRRAEAEHARAAQAGTALRANPHAVGALPAAAPAGTLAAHDRNGDGRLSADEAPDPLRRRFGEADTNDDGYIDAAEWDQAPALADEGPPSRGKVIAQHLITSSDDFIIEVYQNGERVPDDKRRIIAESYGATAERIDVEVREGDWLVFNVANDRLRWGGAHAFTAAGINAEEPKIGFTTELTTGRWSYCDDPKRVPEFIAHPRYLADNPARPPSNPWKGYEEVMDHHAPGWNGVPIWGVRPNTWIKFVARPAPVAAEP